MRIVFNRIKRQFAHYLLHVLMIFLLYEMLWIPIDSYEDNHPLLVPSMAELRIDLVVSMLQGLFITAILNAYYVANRNRDFRHLRTTRYLSLLIGGDLLSSIIVSMAEDKCYEYFLHDFWLWQNQVTNILVLSFISLILIFIDVLRDQATRLKAGAIKREQMLKTANETRLLALQNQTSPHFFFNNLSVAIGLVRSNPDNAAKFLHCLADLYRYHLESNKHLFTDIQTELKHLNTYLQLMSFKHGHGIRVDIDPMLWKDSSAILPGTIELLVSDATKHNSWSDEQPLHIRIYRDGDFFVIENDCRPLTETIPSLRIGKNNLKERYKAIGQDYVTFSCDGGRYIAKVPVIIKK
jgi:two-component system LytT family sensor kinase